MGGRHAYSTSNAHLLAVKGLHARQWPCIKPWPMHCARTRSGSPRWQLSLLAPAASPFPQHHPTSPSGRSPCAPCLQWQLSRLHAQLGTQWSKISRLMGCRTENNIKNHFVSLVCRFLSQKLEMAFPRAALLNC